MSLFWFPVNDNLGYYFTGYVIVSIICSLLFIGIVGGGEGATGSKGREEKEIWIHVLEQMAGLAGKQEAGEVHAQRTYDDTSAQIYIIQLKYALVSFSCCNLKSLCIFRQHIKQQLTRFFFLMVLLRLSLPPSGASTSALSCEWRRMRETRRRLHIKDNTCSFLLATIVTATKIRNWIKYLNSFRAFWSRYYSYLMFNCFGSPPKNSAKSPFFLLF